jgi:hypothetical protein
VLINLAEMNGIVSDISHGVSVLQDCAGIEPPGANILLHIFAPQNLDKGAAKPG